MGQGMINLIDRVKSDLAALESENDPVVLHKRLARDRNLLGQIQTMRSMQDVPGSMMSGNMSNCSGMAQQPQK